MDAFKVDFSELEGLKESLQISEIEFEDFLRSFLVEMANRVIVKTKRKQSGHEGEQYKAYDTGAMTNAWQLGNIQGNGKEISIEILNPMEYATDIEYGHRIVRGGVEVGWYEGRFMLKTSIDEIDRQMPARYKKKLNAFCIERGLGNVN